MPNYRHSFIPGGIYSFIYRRLPILVTAEPQIIFIVPEGILCAGWNGENKKDNPIAYEK